jgi:hypothetical protein
MSWFSSEEKQEEVKPKPRDGGWEFLTDDNDFETWRRKVPGGWLVRTFEDTYYGGGDALTFLPDPNYEWKI